MVGRGGYGDGRSTIGRTRAALTAGQGEDRLLTASESASLRLNAGGWCCRPATPLSVMNRGRRHCRGLAEPYLCRGAGVDGVALAGRESRSAVALMTDLFARRAADPTLSAAKAQQQAILAMIDAPQRARCPHPAYWAPFILVGNPD
ncbi:MAG: CHAT domain-containing protein [Thalassovita sp.]